MGLFSRVFGGYVIGSFTLLNLARWGPYSARTCAQTAPKSSQELGADGYIWLCKIIILYTTKHVFSVCELSQVSKLKSLKFATEAAITILRIDDLVKIAPEPEPQG